MFYLNVKTLLKRIYEKYDRNIDSEDKEEFNCLNEELNSVIIRVDEIVKTIDCIKTENPNIFEIRDNNNETNKLSKDMSNENMDSNNEIVSAIDDCPLIDNNPGNFESYDSNVNHNKSNNKTYLKNKLDNRKDTIIEVNKQKLSSNQTNDEFDK